MKLKLVFAALEVILLGTATWYWFRDDPEQEPLVETTSVQKVSVENTLEVTGRLKPV